MNYFVSEFKLFFLIMTRIMGMFVVAPFFSSLMVKMQLRLLLAFWLTIVLFPMVYSLANNVPGDLLGYSLAVVNEVLIGLIIGMLCTIIFTLFQLSAQFFSFQMGLGISQVYDPMSQIQIPIVGQFQALIGIMIFFAVDGHHALIAAVYKSFIVLPTLDWNNFTTSSILAKTMINSFSKMFIISMKIGFPIIGTMFLLVTSLGLLAKVVPQMNILMLGFPIQIGVGFIAIMVMAPFFVEFAANVLRMTFKDIVKLLYLLG